MPEEKLAVSISNLIVKEVKRRIIEESVVRIEKCISLLTEDEVWSRPNKNCNSVGNLILHLCGNVRQWAIAGISDGLDNRIRQEEFDDPGPYSHKELSEKLKTLVSDLTHILDKICASDLTEIKKVQGFSESVLSILIHVTEHFSYHTGQITFITKMLKDVDTNYYDDINLDITSDNG